MLSNSERSAFRIELDALSYTASIGEYQGDWYIKESIEQSWSTRALERQIDKLYYERLLSSQDSTSVGAEAKQKIAVLEAQDQQLHAKDVLRDPHGEFILRLNFLSYQAKISKSGQLLGSSAYFGHASECHPGN
ncbi:MAG: hypothetical protein R8K20_08660 [Gallionellaceae bacterium]